MQKSMLPLLSLPISSCTLGGERKRGWRGSASVAACLFVGRLMCGSLCWCAPVSAFSQGWTSALCPTACAVTQSTPRRQERCFSFATSRLGRRRGDAARREVQVPAGPKGKQAHMHTHTHTQTRKRVNKKPSLNRLLMPSNKAVLLTWLCVHCESTGIARANYHLWERSRYTPCPCVCVCVGVRMSDTPPCPRLVLSFYIHGSTAPACLAAVQTEERH